MQVIDEETRRFGRLLHYAGLLVTVLMVAAGYSLVHAPKIQGIAETSSRIEELKLMVQNTPIMRERHHKVSERLGAVTTRIMEVQKRVPDEADAGNFLKEVTQLAGPINFTIRDFQPQQPVMHDGYAEMQITLTGSGSYASICTFLDQLSRLNRLSKIKDLTLTAEKIGGEYPMTATLGIYFALQGKDDGSGKTAEEKRRG